MSKMRPRAFHKSNAAALLVSAVIAFAAQSVAASSPSTAPTSQTSSATPMRWIARDGAPLSVRRFLDSVPARRDSYIGSLQSQITALKSQIDQLKQQRGAASKAQVVWKNVGGGESEAEGNAYAGEEHQGMVLSAQIEQKWKEVHADEAKIADASRSLWLPDPNVRSESYEVGADPLPSNYMDYLVQAPVGTNSAPAAQSDQPVTNDPNCLKLVDPVWTPAGTAPVQTLRTGVKGSALKLNVIGVGMRVDAADPTHLTLNSLRRSMGLGELKIAPVATIWLDGDKLNLQWLSRTGEATALKLLQFANLQVLDGSGNVVSTRRFSPRTDATLDCARSSSKTFSLDPAINKMIGWKVDGIPPGWTLQKESTTTLSSGGYITFTLAAEDSSLHVSYDNANASVVVVRNDDLTQRYDTLRQKLSPGEDFEATYAELRKLSEKMSADAQRWRALSNCAASIVLPNGLDVARFTFSGLDSKQPSDRTIRPEAMGY